LREESLGKNKIFTALYGAEPTNADEIFEKCKLLVSSYLPE